MGGPDNIGNRGCGKIAGGVLLGILAVVLLICFT